MEPVTEKQIHDFVSQLQDDLATAQKFLAMWQRRNALVRPETTDRQLPLNGPNNGKEYGTIADQVRAAISKCPVKFTLKNIETALWADGKKIGKPAIAGCMKRLLLAKNPEIKVVQKGVGKRPAKYGRRV